MNPHPQFTGFLMAYPKEIQLLTKKLRSFVIELIPEANELIWDNYNALAMAYSKSLKLQDAFCHIAVYGKYVNLGFNRATEIDLGELELKGNGKLIRHLKVEHWNVFPKDAATNALWNALQHSEMRNPKLVEKTTQGESLVMSVSEKKRRPNSQ